MIRIAIFLGIAIVTILGIWILARQSRIKSLLLRRNLEDRLAEAIRYAAKGYTASWFKIVFQCDEISELHVELVAPYISGGDVDAGDVKFDYIPIGELGEFVRYKIYVQAWPSELEWKNE
jgi:hypothetical protein